MNIESFLIIIYLKEMIYGLMYNSAGARVLSNNITYRDFKFLETRRSVIEEFWINFSKSSTYQKVNKLKIYGIQNESKTLFKLVINDDDIKNQNKKFYNKGKIIEHINREILIKCLKHLNINIDINKIEKSEVIKIIKNNLILNDQVLTIFDEYF